MADASAVVSARPSPLTHLKRAFTWNLGKVEPTASERDALAAAGVADPAVQRYSAWRRSLLLVAFFPALGALALAVLNTLESGLDGLTVLGLVLTLASLLAAATLPVACVMGIRSWNRPGTSTRLLRSAWATAFVLPFVGALLPMEAFYVTDHSDEPKEEREAEEHHTPISEADQARFDKIEALHEVALGVVFSASTFLLLIPAVLSLIPGAMNGCLRVKSLLPAAQLPGWLLVCAAPAFSLLWLVPLLFASDVTSSPLLLVAVILWAGAPIVYCVAARVFVQSQITPEDAQRIGRVKRVAGLVGLAGVALIVVFALNAKVAGIHVLGFEREAALSTRLDELRDADDEVGWEDLQAAYADSTSLAYALDFSSFQLFVDFLSKMLLVTAVFADLVLRATLTAWRNDRALRARAESASYDASASAAASALGSSDGA